jgi:GT2 family glycosyltransferase
MTQSLFTFIILSYNSDKFIHKCLSSINASIKYIKKPCEIFVVDNGSIDSTKKIINDFKFSSFIKFKLISLNKNTGTTYSRNLAIKEAIGKYIVIMDSDAYINPAALIKLQSYLYDNPNCGLAVPKIIYSDGRFQLSTDHFPTIVRKLQRFFYLKSIERTEVSKHIKDVDYAISAFWMMPGDIINSVGLLDENIFYSPEDVDYCIRIWKQGYRITYIPDCEIIHDAQEISRPKGMKLVNAFSISHIKGLIYLYKKHKFLFSGKKFRK